jgi:hypothetical protein
MLERVLLHGFIFPFFQLRASAILLSATNPSVFRVLFQASKLRTWVDSPAPDSKNSARRSTPTSVIFAGHSARWRGA